MWRILKNTSTSSGIFYGKQSIHSVQGPASGHPHDALLCSLFQFMSAIPLGLFTVTAFGRLKYLGVKAVGPSIAVIGETSTFALLSPKLTLLIPLTRFPGFIWPMIAGFMLAAKKGGSGKG